MLLRCGAGDAVLAICAAGARLAWEGEERGEAKDAVETGWRGGWEGESMRYERRVALAGTDEGVVVVEMRRPVVTEGAWLRFRGDGRWYELLVLRGVDIWRDPSFTSTQFLPRSSACAVCRLFAPGVDGRESNSSSNLPALYV